MTENKPEVTEFTADIVVMREDGHILLIRRGSEPFKGMWALPGGYLDSGETPLDAAVRELAEETGIHAERTELREVGVWKEPGRDPRGRFITTVYAVTVPADTAAQAADDAASLMWLPTNTALAVPLAFDHSEILAAAVGPRRGTEWGGR
jgi:8-oxo-dGTP diphosphatase